ncbi:MAG: [Fe-S]-binding protein, partial [Pirellulaceae bacterium]|nr:[Fe-S]-binding protein [Pirellulaceae bacterium]
GRKYRDHIAREDEFPKVRYIAIRGLTKETHGNATGIGLAEFALTRAIASVDQQATLTNCLTGGHATAAMTPVHFVSDQELLDRVLTQIGLTEPENAKVMWIRNTLELAEVECSAAYLNEIRERGDLELLADPRPLEFDASGNLNSAEECSLGIAAK